MRLSDNSRRELAEVDWWKLPLKKPSLLLYLAALLSHCPRTARFDMELEYHIAMPVAQRICASKPSLSLGCISEPPILVRKHSDEIVSLPGTIFRAEYLRRALWNTHIGCNKRQRSERQWKRRRDA